MAPIGPSGAVVVGVAPISEVLPCHREGSASRSLSEWPRSSSVGGGAIAAVGPERIHEKIFGEDEHESVSAFAREHHGINMHSQAVATVMEKLEGGAEEALGPNQMTYEDNAFPRSAISTTQVKHSFSAFAAGRRPRGKPRRRHLEADPQRPAAPCPGR